MYELTKPSLTMGGLELDPNDCILGPDLILRRDPDDRVNGAVTIYRRLPDGPLELVGVYADPGAALAALDEGF
jgi:hypothetical protein